MRSFGRGLDLLIVAAAVGLIPYVASFAARLAEPARASVDPDGVFFAVSVHHAAQLVLTILLMKTLASTTLADWGFRLLDVRRSLRITAWFCVIYLVPVFLVNVLPDLVLGEVPEFGHPLTARNIGGMLGFQFCLSGLCEEPLFRGFVITFLSRSWTGRIRIGRFAVSEAVLWSTFLFMAAHVQFSLHPPYVHASMPQQLWAMGLGVYYGIVFEKTRSLLAPIVSHGYSNGIIFVVLYAWALLAR